MYLQTCTAAAKQQQQQQRRSGNQQQQFPLHTSLVKQYCHGVAELASLQQHYYCMLLILPCVALLLAPLTASFAAAVLASCPAITHLGVCCNLLHQLIVKVAGVGVQDAHPAQAR